MKITAVVYYDILHFFERYRNVETGGMIGSSDGKIIDYFFPDKEALLNTSNCYYPNIISFNNELKKWRDKGISFCGILHSHLTNTPLLSEADQKYIMKIMEKIFYECELYFPVVLQLKSKVSIYGYRVRLSENRKMLLIYEEVITIE